MSTFRKNLITNDWVMFAPNRAARPIDFKKDELNQLDEMLQRPEIRDDCPFCQGNESKNGEVCQFDEANSWSVRVIENKFASLDRTKHPKKSFHHLHNEMDGFGIHDVIVDTPKHNRTIALLSSLEIVNLLKMYRKRYVEIAKTEHVRHVVIFKNQGYKAGGSLEHPHSQIYGLPVIPFQLRVRLNEAKKYFESHTNCLMCDIIEAEKNDEVRVLYENEHFISFIPYASLSPYHVWLVPKIHQSSFSQIEDEQIESLSDCMKNTFHMSFEALKNIDFNYIFQSLTNSKEGGDYFHWYLSVIYHQKRRGGIEFAGGLFVNPLMPEDAAKNLRQHRLKK